MIHYHIRWSNSKLDWQTFANKQEAKKSAEELVRPGEAYTIEEFGDECERCGADGKVGKLGAARI